MHRFVVHAIDPSIAAQVRSTLLAPGYGHPVHREVARGTGPCRSCLQTFTVGSDERLLFTYDPFAGRANLAQPGPVFIHARECQRHEGAAYPAGLRELPVVVQSHYDDGATSSLRTLTPGQEDEELGALLVPARVRFLHLRHGDAGCFIARVDRAE